MGKEGFSLKKTVISLLLAMTLILSMPVSVFAGNYSDPDNIAKYAEEQVIPK